MKFKVKSRFLVQFKDCSLSFGAGLNQWICKHAHTLRSVLLNLKVHQIKLIGSNLSKAVNVKTRWCFWKMMTNPDVGAVRQ